MRARARVRDAGIVRVSSTAAFVDGNRGSTGESSQCRVVMTRLAPMLLAAAMAAAAVAAPAEKYFYGAYLVSASLPAMQSLHLRFP